MPLTHTTKVFDLELEQLTDNIRMMGSFAGTQFTDAVKSLLQGDTALAHHVVDQDQQLDALRHKLSASAALVIARRQPVAIDLDEVLADFRIVEDLERIGDLAKNIAKRAIALAGAPIPADLATKTDQMATLAANQLRRALDTFAARDADEALIVRQQDEAVDELHTMLFRDVVARMGEESMQTINFVHLLFTAKNIERVGDHAAHVAEAAYIKATGRRPDIERRRLDESSATSSSALTHNDGESPAEDKM
jgi:phosphate transport system protein